MKNLLSAFIVIIFTLLVATGVSWCEENLALGREVRYSAEPDFPADNGPGASRLTDGSVTGKPLEVKSRAGWRYSHNGVSSQLGMNLMIDLGREYHLNRSEFRLLTKERYQNKWRKPYSLSIFVSKDGKSFHRVKTLREITYSGPGKEDPRTEIFYLDKKAPLDYRTYSFNLEGLPARYVGLRIRVPFVEVMTDEWRIIKSPEQNQASAEHAETFYSGENQTSFGIPGFTTGEDAFVFSPIRDEFQVCTNAPLPVFIRQADYRPKGFRQKVDYVIEVPEGIRLLSTRLLSHHSLGHETVERQGERFNRYTLRVNEAANKTQRFEGEDEVIWTGRIVHQRAHLNEVGPLYFTTDQEYEGQSKASFYAKADDFEFTVTEVPIFSFELPDAIGFDAAPVGLTWMQGWYSTDWPDFLETYQRIGFNYFPVFAMYYFKDGNRLPKRLSHLVTEAREAGLDIAMIDSSIHVMTYKYKSNPEYLGQGEIQNRVCPSYRGDQYTWEMDRIRRCVKKLSPDLVYLDIELFGGCKRKASTCPVCLAGAREAGLSMEDYLLRCGREILEDVIAAATVDRERPVGMYHMQPGKTGYQDMFTFEEVYPEPLSLSQNSLYLGGELDLIHDELKEDYVSLLEPWVNRPWLTAGTYGEFPPFKMEPMVYDALLNGNGITFFSFVDFEPEDYFYVAKALSSLVPYQEILEKGEPAPHWEGADDALDYSAFIHGNEGLYLMANFRSPRKEDVSLVDSSSESKLTVIASRGAEIDADQKKVSIEPQGFLFVHASVNQASKNAQ
jgi:hypothetical protein